MPPEGLPNNAAAPAPIKPISTAFMTMMIDRLLALSASTPATSEIRTSGSVKTAKARVVRLWDAASRAGPGSMVAATCLMLRRATMSFQALSLKAPQN